MKAAFGFGAAMLAPLMLASGAAPLGAQGVAVREGGVLTGRPTPLRRFASAREFETYLRQLRDRVRREQAMAPPPVAAPPPPAPPPLPAAAPETGIVVTASRVDAADATNPEITNNQTVGVDEGGIVKQIGRFLIVLQDGRLFSADLGEGEGAPLRLADRIDVYRNRQVAANWYDEMLVLGDRILVTAYNYRERASEITVFRTNPQGRMRREARFLLSSSDYYSTDNYATRLVGDKLVFYAPFPINRYSDRFEWPRVRRAEGDGDADQGRALFGATSIYAPPFRVDNPVLHAVSVCPLTTTLDCTTTGFIGPAMREFYVSPTDAYVWICAPDGLPWAIDYGNRRRTCPSGHYWRDGSDEGALLYRVPLNGGRVGAVGVDGIPADQFAFEARGGRFRALLGRSTGGCVRYSDPRALRLLDIPLVAFDVGVRHVAERAYTPLPAIEGGALENRFIGDWLVYGGRANGSSAAPEPRARPSTTSLFAVPLARPSAPVRLALPHNAIRIERACNDAIVTGYRDARGLAISMVRLGSDPAIASTALLAGRFESEGRSHAFNAWARADGSGILGIPTVKREWQSGRGWSNSASSDLSFLTFDAGRTLSPAGQLALGQRTPSAGYRCEVSCIDWYGNTRPVFTMGRIFALMGTDLVDGRLAGVRVTELRRLDLTGAPR